MDIILIRHGKTYDNEKKIYGQDDTSLSEVGIEQIKQTREELKNYKFDKVYYSPHTRTKETLDILGLEGEALDVLKEYDFGIFKGKTFKEISRLYNDEVKNWVADTINYKIPEGDCLKERYEEVSQFLNKLEEKQEDVLLVTHAGVIQLAMCWAFDNLDYYFKFKISNGSINVISIYKKFKMISKLS